MRKLKLLGIKNLEDFAFGLGILLISVFTLLLAFLPLTPILDIFQGQFLLFTVITLLVSFFSMYVSIGWIVQNLIGLSHYQA